MPPEETPGVVAASDEAVHHSPPPPSVIKGHRDHKRKQRKHDANDNDALPQELAAGRLMIDAGRGSTEPAAPTGGVHRSRRRAPAAERRTMGVGPSSSRDDMASPSVAPPPAPSKAIRVKHSSSFVIGDGDKQHPATGSDSSPGGGDSHSHYANSHAAAAPSSSSRLTTRVPPVPPPAPLHLRPPKARRPSSAPAPSAAMPLEPKEEEEDDDDNECFSRGLDMFRGWDFAAQQVAVNRFVRQQPPPPAKRFSFCLTSEEAAADLQYLHSKVKEAQRNADSSSGKTSAH